MATMKVFTRSTIDPQQLGEQMQRELLGFGDEETCISGNSVEIVLRSKDISVDQMMWFTNNREKVASWIVNVE